MEIKSKPNVSLVSFLENMTTLNANFAILSAVLWRLFFCVSPAEISQTCIPVKDLRTLVFRL